MTGSSSVSKDRFNFVFFFSVYKVRWWSEEVGAMLHGFLIGGEERCMENRVDLPSERNAETERHS